LVLANSLPVKLYEGTGEEPCFRTKRGVTLRANLGAQGRPAKENQMNGELLAMIERELLGWPGVRKETHGGGAGRGGFRVPPATVYRYGRRQIGHIHDTGVADLTFPREVHDELISEGLAEPHRGGFPAVVSYHIRGPEDVRGALDLYRMSYERARAAAERRTGRRNE
jgi:hypothetical protein